jgi:hypothetical protein
MSGGLKLVMLTAKKKRGRPATGRAPVVRLRMSVEKQAEVFAWGKRNGLETFSSAIRHLIDQGLERDLPKRREKMRRTAHSESAGVTLMRLCSLYMGQIRTSQMSKTRHLEARYREIFLFVQDSKCMPRQCKHIG